MNHRRGLVTFLLMATAILISGSVSLLPVHATVVTLDQSVADTFYGCSTGTNCESAAEISSNPNRYVLVFMNMRQAGAGAGSGTWGTFSHICLAASGSTCESGNFLTLTKESVEPNPTLDTQLMLADAYTTTGFTNYMLRYEYTTVGYDLDEFGFDASTWANTATTSPFFEGLNSCNAEVGITSTNAVCSVVSGTAGRVVVAAFSLDAYSCDVPGVTPYQTAVTSVANYACSVAPIDFHGVEYTQTSSSVNMEFGLSSAEPTSAYLSWAMISLGILPSPPATTPSIPEYPIGLPMLAVLMIVAYGLINRRTRAPNIGKTKSGVANLRLFVSRIGCDV